MKLMFKMVELFNMLKTSRIGKVFCESARDVNKVVLKNAIPTIWIILFIVVLLAAVVSAVIVFGGIALMFSEPSMSLVWTLALFSVITYVLVVIVVAISKKISSILEG